jgi:hypothetical protein
MTGNRNLSAKIKEIVYVQTSYFTEGEEKTQE